MGFVLSRPFGRKFEDAGSSTLDAAAPSLKLTERTKLEAFVEEHLARLG